MRLAFVLTLLISSMLIVATACPDSSRTTSPPSDIYKVIKAINLVRVHDYTTTTPIVTTHRPIDVEEAVAVLKAYLAKTESSTPVATKPPAETSEALLNAINSVNAG